MINKVNEVLWLIYYRMFQVAWFWLILSTSKNNYFSFDEAIETGIMKTSWKAMPASAYVQSGKIAESALDHVYYSSEVNMKDFSGVFNLPLKF